MNNDRDVLQAIFKYGNCMLILPKYDFVKNKVEISIWRVICSIVLILLTLLGFAISITGRIVESYDLVKGTQAFLDFSTYSLLTSINISIILEALLKRNAWEQLLKMLLATTVNVTRRQRLSYVFWFSLLHAYFLAVLIFDNYVWWHDAEAHLFKYYFLRILQEYPCLLMVFFTGVVNSMLRSRFEVLNTLLSNSTAFGCKNTISVISSKKHRHLGCASERFIYLYNAVVLFNRIYSWQNFLIVTYAVFSILDNLDKAMWYSSLSREGPVSYTKFFVCVSVASLAMTKLVGVAIPCDLTTREASKIVVICYLQQQLHPATSSERYELMKLAALARDLRPCFTAAAFFEITRSSLFHVLSVVTTYFIVLLQFNFD